MNIRKNLDKVRKELEKTECKLIAVSKTYAAETIREAYDEGQRDFGENKVQEIVSKKDLLPEDIRWHLIGHLQSNKVKYIAPFIHLIQSVDSLKLLREINKEGRKNNRMINCLLQIHIAEEESKFGMSFEECEQLLSSAELANLENIQVLGLMGMATFTENCDQVKKEFRKLNVFFKNLKTKPLSKNVSLKELSMGMSGDYKIALEEGSTMVRVGSAIFGQREYT